MMGEKDAKRYYVLLQAPARKCLEKKCPHMQEGAWFRALVEERGASKRLISVEGDIQNARTERKSGVAVDGSSKDSLLSNDGTAPFSKKEAGAQRPALEDREESDDRGHFIAARFGGPTNAWNLRPMAASTNRSGGAWYAMEEKIAGDLNKLGMAASRTGGCPMYAKHNPEAAPSAPGAMCLVMRGKGTMRVKADYDKRDPNNARPLGFHATVIYNDGSQLSQYHRNP